MTTKAMRKIAGNYEPAQNSPNTHTVLRMRPRALIYFVRFVAILQLLDMMTGKIMRRRRHHRMLDPTVKPIFAPSSFAKKPELVANSTSSDWCEAYLLLL